jgi:CBS domain containing-hemolysin-like protein
MVPELPIFLVCLVMSAFFSGSETALMAAPRLRLRRLRDEGDAHAGRVLDLVEDPRRLLAGILVGNNIFNVLAASSATALALRYLHEGTGMAVATASTTILLVLFSEYLPKTFAALDPIAFSRRVANIVRVALTLLAPLVLPLEAITRPLGKLIGRGHGVGLAELRIAVSEGVRSGAVDPTMARVLRGGLSMEWKTVADALVPRVDVAVIESKSDYTECRRRFREEKYSRLLVMEGSIDTDMGYVAAKDLANLEDSDIEGWTAGQGARQALRIPVTLPLPRLLARMRKSGVHFAVVKDEYGGTEGIVTLEDLLEELVGEIRDEHDVDEEAPVLAVGEGRWLLKGDVSVKDLYDRFAVQLDAEDSRTVGGFVAEELGRVPEPGDVIEGAGYKIRVEKVEDNRVMQLRLERES